MHRLEIKVIFVGQNKTKHTITYVCSKLTKRQTKRPTVKSSVTLVQENRLNGTRHARHTRHARGAVQGATGGLVLERGGQKKNTVKDEAKAAKAAEDQYV